MADEKTAKLALDKFNDELLGKKNVTGTGIQALDSGELGVAVYVEQKVAREQLSDRDLIPEALTVEVAGRQERIPVKVIDVGGAFEAEPL